MEDDNLKKTIMPFFGLALLVLSACSDLATPTTRLASPPVAEKATPSPPHVTRETPVVARKTNIKNVTIYVAHASAGDVLGLPSPRRDEAFISGLHSGLYKTSYQTFEVAIGDRPLVKVQYPAPALLTGNLRVGERVCVSLPPGFRAPDDQEGDRPGYTCKTVGIAPTFTNPSGIGIMSLWVIDPKK